MAISVPAWHTTSRSRSTATTRTRSPTGGPRRSAGRSNRRTRRALLVAAGAGGDRLERQVGTAPDDRRVHRNPAEDRRQPVGPVVGGGVPDPHAVQPYRGRVLPRLAGAQAHGRDTRKDL